MPAAEPTRCPVCQAPWRHTATCPRCGADLAPLMTAVVKAWSLRRRARHALRDGDYRRAIGLAEAADDTARTAASHRLLRLAQLLHRATHRQ